MLVCAPATGSGAAATTQGETRLRGRRSHPRTSAPRFTTAAMERILAAAAPTRRKAVMQTSGCASITHAPMLLAWLSRSAWQISPINISSTEGPTCLSFAAGARGLADVSPALKDLLGLSLPPRSSVEERVVTVAITQRGVRAELQKHP